MRTLLCRVFFFFFTSASTRSWSILWQSAALAVRCLQGVLTVLLHSLWQVGFSGSIGAWQALPASCCTYRHKSQAWAAELCVQGQAGCCALGRLQAHRLRQWSEQRVTGGGLHAHIRLAGWEIQNTHLVKRAAPCARPVLIQQPTASHSWARSRPQMSSHDVSVASESLLGFLLYAGIKLSFVKAVEKKKIQVTNPKTTFHF